MNSLRVVGGSAHGEWSLILRWPNRSSVAQTVPSSLRIEAAGGFTITLPDGASAAGVGTWEEAVPPFLWEPPRLLVALERTSAGPALSVDHPDSRVRDAIVDPTGTGRSCSGALDLSERVGFLTLTFRSEAQADPLVSIRVEIFPSKLDYRADLQVMLAEVAQTRPSEVVSLLTRTHVRSGLIRRSERSLQERFQILTALFPRIERSLRVIAAQPHSGLTSTGCDRPVERIRRPNGRTLQAAARSQRRDVWMQGIALPRRLPDGRRVPTWDTTPNRYVRGALHTIEVLLACVARLKDGKKGAWTDTMLQDRVAALRGRIREWQCREFLLEARQVPCEPDLAMERSPGYRDFLRAYRMTLLAFSLFGDDADLDLADLDRIYEIWCEERLKNTLSGLLGEPTAEAKSTSALRALRYPDGTRLLVKPVVREFADDPAHLPDFGVEMFRPAPRAAGGVARFLFLFDAKYRLDWTNPDQPKAMQDAVNAIHRYRDAMVRDGDSRTVREVYGGAILFPHPNETAFEELLGSAWNLLPRLGVGAIPLTPSNDRLFRGWLNELVNASAVRLDRMGPPYRPLPPPPRVGTVLLAPTPYGQAQVAQIERDHWLHVRDDVDLASRKPTHVALLESAAEAGKIVKTLFPILKWSEVSGDWVRERAEFGGGHSGGRDRYKVIRVGAPEVLDPPIDGADWWPRQHGYVPLEVLDLAESTFLLRGDERHVALIRLLHHVRRVARTGAEGWQLREPLLVAGRRVGELQASGEGISWTAGAITAGCTIDEVLRRPVEALFKPWLGLI